MAVVLCQTLYYNEQNEIKKGGLVLKRYQAIITVFAAMLLITTPVFAQTQPINTENITAEQKQQTDIAIQGETIVTKSSAIYNINPYNPATIQGVGEEGKIQLLDKEGTVEIPLSHPLYSLSEAYTDKIICKDGVWGIERNVGLKIFDGSEDWQRVSEGKFFNKNTTIFECSAPEKVLVRNGLSTHFDVHTTQSQKTNIYDGISFSENREKIYMRTMNVKNMSTIETLSAYLKAQYDAGTPVKFLYALQQPQFEVFEEGLQQKLNAVNWDTVGVLDSNIKIVKRQEKVLDENLFTQKTSGNEIMDNFLLAAEDIKIYGEPDEKGFYVFNIASDRDCFAMSIKNENGHRFYGELRYDDYDFLSNKPVEFYLYPKENTPKEAYIEIKMNLSKIKAPATGVSGFDSNTTGIQDRCIQKEEFVLPQYTPVVEGVDLVQYPKNALLNATEANRIVLLQGQEKKQVTQYSLLQTDSPVVLALDEDTSIKASTEIRTVPKEAGAGLEKTVLFLGDSLINENAYTQSVQELFQQDSMKVKLIGTRGTEENKHEGRGGWSAYDYCNATEKYGFTNPFLKDGKFDFGYYMQSNEYAAVDYVVVSLGVNDLNLVGHNGHDEIIGYFNTIFESIHQYDPNIKIILNTPTMLFFTEKTEGAKNTRLEFTKTLQQVYGDKESEGIYLSAISMSIDPAMNFKWVESVDKSQPMSVTDTTHPNLYGYQNMAKTTYAFLKYLAYTTE